MTQYIKLNSKSNENAELYFEVFIKSEKAFETFMDALLDRPDVVITSVSKEEYDNYANIFNDEKFKLDVNYASSIE